MLYMEILHGNTFHMVLREHLDSDMHRGEDCANELPCDRKKELLKHLKMVKKNKPTGPDKIKGELYRSLGESKMCVKTLQKVFQNIIDKDLKIKSWGKTNKRLIPTVNKPTAKQLRPIALTDVSYKLFMTIIGKKIGAHQLDNHEKLDTQAGFTTGSMIEDNLFVLQYCIERSFKLRRPLLVTCLDYSKSFDSIKRAKRIETLIQYKVHYNIIEVVANIYKDDYTEIQFGDIRKNIEITTGITQGCTGSTILSKCVTYVIMAG